ncbi:MAG: hypothetical protein RBG13Loki_4378 [Promethearchaeota archaeon CR_4]|nr:MAG: hypothetical protein RBG13Loki_4378 [Candidatus Lokiarchaeota archaeon CR_4]
MENDLEDDIPAVPIPKPKQIDPVMSQPVFRNNRYVNDPNYTHVLVECELCGGVIKMPVPTAYVVNSKLPVVPITYTHGQFGIRHALLAHLDHDFQVRRTRVSYLVEE